MNDALRREFGNRTVQQVISGDRVEIMNIVRTNIDDEIASLGIEVIDVRVKRIDFPQEVSSAVFERMRADREKEARQYRSEGFELAEKIRADADREKVVIEAEAYRSAEEVRGEGDARAATIYADAYSKDEEFYAFLRRLNAYETAFSNKGDIFLVDPDSDFFRYLENIDGK